ncbi:hypothetical protein RvY_14374-2 [Ramazzottius varieornatus]|uniref:Uncharacterized protein n=1 Tax=Ramazzottius varieornatus TaxID=947166 RepID=A0A1D1VR54_RAMVA|nr:hypothetical protein RvY_14374-2 [Ramazzottius varieornatus]
MLTRSLSDGNNVACQSSRTKVSNHPAITRPHQPSASSRLLQIPPSKTTTYRSCPHHTKPLPQHHGSYWSPVISEIDYPFEPLGTRSLISKARLSRLILFLLQLSLTISHITLTVQHKHLEDLANLYFVVFYSSAFLTTVFSPVISARISKSFIVVSGIISAFLAASTLFIPQMGILLAISVINGSCWGLVMVKPGLSALNLGLQYACIKDLKDRKGTAADWYLWSQVALHNGALLGSMIFAGTKKLLTLPQATLQPTLKMPCGRSACGTSDSKIKMPPFGSARSFASLNQTLRPERPSLIDDGHANGILAVIAACWALTALAVLGLTYCCSPSRRKKRRQRYDGNSSGGGGNHLRDDQSSLSLDGSQASTQVFHETAISQLRQIADLLLYDHKLQTVLPLVLFTGMQSAFIFNTFTKVLTSPL